MFKKILYFKRRINIGKIKKHFSFIENYCDYLTLQLMSELVILSPVIVSMLNSLHTHSPSELVFNSL